MSMDRGPVQRSIGSAQEADPWSARELERARARRAAEARRFLMEQGIDASRLETVGYGEEQPLDQGSTESAWAVNRRADFHVTGGAISQR